MGELRPLNVQAERYLLRWRTRRGRDTATRYLELLAVALRPKGWRIVRLYHAEEFAMPVPLLWVYAGGTSEHVGVAVSVLATSGGTWAYHEAQRGRRGYLFPCGDAKAAADQVDNLLKHRMFPGTW